MKRVRIGIIGCGSVVEWTLLPTLSSPDVVSPPDVGAWWARRGDNADIQYQAPARPEIVAIAETESEQRSRRVERVAQMARVRGVYSDWRSMLREVELDALLCIASPAVTAEVISATGGTKPLWIYGAPSASISSLRRLRDGLDGRDTKLWCSWPLRSTSAHRAARQLIERDQIGAPTSLVLRWPNAWESNIEHDANRFSSALAALDLLRTVAETPTSSTRSERSNTSFQAGACAFENNAATQVLLRFANGTNASALFSGGETWSAPLPRLEICGTQGRWMACESGRRLWLHHPRESARFWEPPGISNHVSGANVAGIAEDLKAFLAFCVDEMTSSTRTSAREGVPHNALRDYEVAWRWHQTICDSLSSGQFAALSPQNLAHRIDEPPTDAPPIARIAPALSPTLTLPL